MPKSCQIIFVEITFQFKITTLFKYTSANNIVCLQLLKHASSNLYLRVPTGFTTWTISDTIDDLFDDNKGDLLSRVIEDYEAMIKSGSSGGLCPACPSNTVSGRLGRTSWRFADGVGGWHNEDIVVTCATHSC